MKLMVIILVLMIPGFLMCWPAPETATLTWQFIQVSETRGFYLAVWSDSCVTLIVQDIDPSGYKFNRVVLIPNGGYGVYQRISGAFGR